MKFKWETKKNDRVPTGDITDRYFVYFLFAQRWKCVIASKLIVNVDYIEWNWLPKGISSE